MPSSRGPTEGHDEPAATNEAQHRELDTKIMRSSAWAALGYGTTNVLSLLSALVLARFLAPAEFGIVALAVSLLAAVRLAQDSGLGAAIVVHRGDIRRAAASASVFAPLIGAGLYATCFIAAPFLARFFDQPELTTIFRAISLIVVMRGFVIVPIALLQREMKYVPITSVELGAGIAQAAVAIALAIAGAGAWALVGGQLAAGLTELVLGWTLAPFRPRLRDADRKTLRSMTSYGRFVGMANLINYGNVTVDGLVTGKVLGTAVLGFYSFGRRLSDMPVQIIGNILGRGVFAAFARMQEHREGFRRVWLENIQRLALLVIPATIGLVVVAKPLVLTLLGEQWRPVVVPLQILAFAGFVKVFSATSGEVFQALLRPQLRVMFEGAHLLLVVPGVIVGAHVYGVKGVATAIVLVDSVVGLVVVRTVMRALDVSSEMLTTALARPAVGWVAMAAALLGARAVMPDARPWIELLSLVALGALVYAAVIFLVAREIVSSMWMSLRGTT